ncbi:MAG: tRNA adenosine(34) deaminase TadA [Gammaproteobacteria bacterium WSBS_2016_MAG_OTU1]
MQKHQILTNDNISPADHNAMRRALELAAAAATAGEVPVGAVVYESSGNIIGEGQNCVIQKHDPTAHAEVVALRDAANHRGNYRLPDCKIAVTLEPCLMCAGAIFHARLVQLVFAATDNKTGAFGGVAGVQLPQQLNHHTAFYGGLYAEESAALLHDFFRARR